MTKKELIKDIKFYITYLSNCFTSCLLNERLNDWYENNKEILKKSNLFLSFTSKTLVKDFVNTFYSLFTESKNDNSIYRLYNKINNTRKTTEWITTTIREKNEELMNEIKGQNIVIESASNWRCDIYAHITTKSFNPLCWDKFKKDNKIETLRMLDLIYFSVNCLNNMLVELNENPEVLILSNLYDLDKIFAIYCNAIPPRFSIDVNRYSKRFI